MVKVKGVKFGYLLEVLLSFNHPMVKVKVNIPKHKNCTNWFQPPYGES